jgi:hypothetical protein
MASAPKKTAGAEKKVIDWKIVEREYRAGIKTLRQISEECGVSHVAIQKRANKEEWSRDLQAKIKAKAAEKVTKSLVTKGVTKDQLVTERQVIEANAAIVASADLINRKDVLLALDVSRSQLEEVATMCRPDLREVLEQLADEFDMSSPVKADKANELYRYIISLAGRVKMSKEIAAAHGVYIPMQRKILKLDEEGDKNQSNLDAILAKINAATD